jgi:hypothetical protein
VAGSPLSSGARTAQYHAVAATALWRDFVAGLMPDITRSPDQRQRRDDERKRETTYARHELGRH